MPSVASANVNPDGLSNMIRRQYTCIPDCIDLSLLGSSVRGNWPLDRKLPPDIPKSHRIDTSGWTVHNQELEKSCVGYAASTLREHYLYRRGVGRVQLSPLFIYWWARKFDNIQLSDGGSRLMHAVACLTQYGVCGESYHPSVAGTNADVFVEPSTAAMVSAAQHKIRASYPVTALDELRSAIASDHPVLIGIPVFESMETSVVESTGKIPMPGPQERILGGHAMVACGYSDDTREITVHNSWGSNWGAKGHGFVPYDLLLRYRFDGWEIRA